jgi:hypothetical protein
MQHAHTANFCKQHAMQQFCCVCCGPHHQVMLLEVVLQGAMLVVVASSMCCCCCQQCTWSSTQSTVLQVGRGTQVYLLISTDPVCFIPVLPARRYGNAGGVSYVNAFGNSFYSPSFVFPGKLGPNFAKYIWEATSHEVSWCDCALCLPHSSFCTC